MKLEINDYIKINGFISKIDYIKKTKNGNEYGQFKEPNGMISHINSKLIEKASHNIIDLIKVGDYVNGFPVEDYFRKYNEEKDIFENIGVITTECYLEDTNFSWILEKDIKTILTKEQFENNCYKVGD